MQIGEGAFGEVSFANVQSHGLVAVKWLKRERFAKYSESFMQEAEVLAKLNHPNIIRMYGVVIEREDASGASGTHPSSGGGSASGGGARASAPAPQIAGIMTDYVRGGSLSGQLRAAKRRPTLRERCQVRCCLEAA
jgi:serine/threonine protein kinase